MSRKEKREPDRPIANSNTVPTNRQPAVQWQQLFEQSKSGLRAFLRNRLAQESDIDDCLQTVYLRIMESGLDVAPPARRAWLFRVAANESARYWRSQASTERMLAKQEPNEPQDDNPIQSIIDTETAFQVHQSLEQLPETWREVFRLRMEEDLTFSMISERLKIPIGTALTRMRRCLEHLRSELDSEQK